MKPDLFHRLTGKDLRFRRPSKDTPPSNDFLMDEKTLDELNQTLIAIFTKEFGEYGFTTILRYADRMRVRHSREQRSRTLVMNITDDIQFNINETRWLVKTAVNNDEVRIAFLNLFQHLDELLEDHLLSERNTKSAFFNLTNLHLTLKKCLTDYQQRRWLFPPLHDDSQGYSV